MPSGKWGLGPQRELHENCIIVILVNQCIVKTSETCKWEQNKALIKSVKGGTVKWQYKGRSS